MSDKVERLALTTYPLLDTLRRLLPPVRGALAIP